MSKPRLTALDKAIAAIDAKIAVLYAAKQELEQQKTSQPKRKPRSQPALTVASGG